MTKAEELQIQILSAYQRMLGDEHPITQNSMLNLASTYRSQELLKKAGEFGPKVLGQREKTFHYATYCINIFCPELLEAGRNPRD
ncbi:hypothetical protein MGYG_03538 [Nannizzia gypsea CBS 118893]|uniref:Tetratricopeptide repeat protein n=1 Tax=Arthroderma gypseum (strain ATCC MYA-4604 / CBS 118893) TaxID=535722 RepID=E4USG7_ARTGP|nr:hypothetical protein MGYG_03538 [Nannizzia gypsea CBS 118893]EFR00534.1 hypothetical protein MGYG_03538 [Nannizzia gypsea CBS 118893]